MEIIVTIIELGALAIRRHYGMAKFRQIFVLLLIRSVSAIFTAIKLVFNLRHSMVPAELQITAAFCEFLRIQDFVHRNDVFRRFPVTEKSRMSFQCR